MSGVVAYSDDHTFGGTDPVGLPQRIDDGDRSKDSGYLDVLTGENSLSDSRLKQGLNRQRILNALTRDFYRPLRVAELHERINPAMSGVGWDINNRAGAERHLLMCGGMHDVGEGV